MERDPDSEDTLPPLELGSQLARWVEKRISYSTQKRIAVCLTVVAVGLGVAVKEVVFPADNADAVIALPKASSDAGIVQVSPEDSPSSLPSKKSQTNPTANPSSSSAVPNLTETPK